MYMRPGPLSVERHQERLPNMDAAEFQPSSFSESVSSCVHIGELNGRHLSKRGTLKSIPSLSRFWSTTDPYSRDL